MKWSCCEGGNVLRWENSASSARQMEGVAWLPGVRPRVNSSSIIVSHILITFCTSHLVITCGPGLRVWSRPRPVLISICPGTSLKNNTRLSSVLCVLLLWFLGHQSFSLLPPPFCVIVGFLFSSHDNSVFVTTWCRILSKNGMSTF